MPSVVGIPREIKEDEGRIAIAPAGVHVLDQAGQQVLIESGAGLGSGITDEEFNEAGAEIVSREEVFSRGEIIVKVKEPLEEEYDLYFKVASLFAKVIGNPALIRELTRVGMRSKPLMEWALRVMANLLRDEERGAAEAAYGAIAAVVRLVPDRLTKVGAA